jgi:hypothetical protein
MCYVSRWLRYLYFCVRISFIIVFILIYYTSMWPLSKNTFPSIVLNDNVIMKIKQTSKIIPRVIISHKLYTPYVYI